MVAGVAIDAPENGWLELLSKQNRQDRMRADHGGNHDLPYFLNIFDTSIDKLYPAEVLRR